MPEHAFNVIFGEDCEDDNVPPTVLEFQDRSLDLLKERERMLVSALQHYADPKNWTTCRSSRKVRHYTGFTDHGWQLAQDALKELGL